MKLAGRTLTSLLLFVVFLGATTFGQTATSVIKVNIPFEFTVGEKIFPAGDYSLTQPIQHFLVLRDARGKTVASAFTSGVDVDTPVATPTLRFESIGDLHVLTELWQEQGPAGQRLVGTKARTMVARHRSVEARAAAEGSQP